MSKYQFEENVGALIFILLYYNERTTIRKLSINFNLFSALIMYLIYQLQLRV